MKNLEVPGLGALTKAYNCFQSGQKISETQLVRYAQWIRFDPRLGEIILEYIQKNWNRMNSFSLRKANYESPCPQVFAVVLEQVDLLFREKNKLFYFFKGLILEGIEPLPYQSFTIGVFNPGGKALRDRAFNPHPLYQKWGFYEANLLISKTNKIKSSTLMDIDSRKKILKGLLKLKKKITVNEYMEACRFSVHRRQAERDLNKFFSLKKSGHTRNRVYEISKPRTTS